VSVTCILRAAYIQKRSGSKLEVAKDVTAVIFQVSPSFDPASPSEASQITAAVNTTFGSAHAKIPVPKDATPAGYTLQLFTVIKTTPPSSDGTVIVLNSAEGVIPLEASSSSAAVAAMPEAAMQSEPQPAVAVAPGYDGVVPPKLPQVPVEQPGDLLASASFTVGDPRPPTATLAIDAPAWVKPTDSVTVKLTAESYIGSGEGVVISGQAGPFLYSAHGACRRNIAQCVELGMLRGPARSTCGCFSMQHSACTLIHQPFSSKLTGCV
jgi:hypothetical protein